MTQDSGRSEYKFSALDLAELKEHDISPEEAQRQINLLCSPPVYAEISRPCSIGDGILEFDAGQQAELLKLHESASSAGRLIKFVPASGAASRMFRELLCRIEATTLPSFDALLSSPAAEDKFLHKFLSEIESFPFTQELKALAAKRGITFSTSGKDYIEIIKLLLLPESMNYAQLPKALLPFHRYSIHDTRFAIEEHLIEAVLTVKDTKNNCRLHFTVSPEHRKFFENFLDRKLLEYEKRFGCKFHIEFSVQKPSTETLAVSLEQEPFHDERGVLLFRPGGHGALIENLNDLNADIVFIKNIDNIQRDENRETCMLSKRLLAGKLIKLQSKLFEVLKRLIGSSQDSAILHDAASFAKAYLHIETPGNISAPAAIRDYLLKRLNAPIRVCGVVRNTGEPGGGPFWVKGPDGDLSLQIVEGAQIDSSDPAQRRLFDQSTHFNPVDLVCGLRDFEGNQFDLHKFIDERAVIKTKKSYQGRDLISCERPGLWNGAMAGWITVFVEVPAETFTPVKNVNDLLRPAHRGL